MLYNYPAGWRQKWMRSFWTGWASHQISRLLKKVQAISTDYICWPAGIRISACLAQDDQALEFFAWGARSWVCAASNFAPSAHPPYGGVCRGWGCHWSAYYECNAAADAGSGAGRKSFVSKYGAERMGLPAGVPRPPLKPLNKDEKRTLDQVIDRMNATISHILDDKQAEPASAEGA